MTGAARARGAFTLVEVIVAIGIVTFAVVSMVALMSSLLGNEQSIAEETEAMQLVPSLNDFLQSNGFATVYGWTATPASQPLILAYCRKTNNQVQVVITNVASAVLAPADLPMRSGRLFRATLSFSPDNPAGLASLPADPSTYPSFALPLRVTLNNTPTASVVPSSNNVVLSYETAITR